MLTPGLTGADGISFVSRQAVEALRTDRPERSGKLEVWSLADTPGRTGNDRDPWSACRSASGSRLRFASWGLRAGIGRCRDTLVVVMHLDLAPVALPMAARGARLAVFLHGIEAWRRLRGLRAAAVGRASLVVANSHHTVERFRAANPAFRGAEIRICLLGVPACPGEAPPPADDAVFALIVGRMSAAERYKGHDLLLEIWPKVLAEMPDASLFVVGDGDDRTRLERKAASMGLGRRVRFFGQVTDEVLAGLYRDCTFFLMPSRNEGFGLVFLEAMRAGKACIGGVGAAAEVIEHGRTGLAVDPDRPQDVLSAVLALFREAETRERMGRAGAARLEREFTEEHFRRRFRTLLGLEAGEKPCVA